MSIGYTVFTINKETLEWLDSFGVIQPYGLETMVSRYPIPNEIYEIIQDLNYLNFEEYGTGNRRNIFDNKIQGITKGSYPFFSLNLSNTTLLKSFCTSSTVRPPSITTHRSGSAAIIS
jgi:hypothetical protein